MHTQVQKSLASAEVIKMLFAKVTLVTISYNRLNIQSTMCASAIYFVFFIGVGIVSRESLSCDNSALQFLIIAVTVMQTLVLFVEEYSFR